MKLLQKSTGKLIDGVLTAATKEDINSLARNKGFSFNWKLERKNEIYKLVSSQNKEEILGLISISNHPEELRIHISLLEVTKSQVGKTKTLENIAGGLIAFACELAFKRGYGGFVSLRPKTELIEHYQKKYGFRQYGRLLAVEYENSKYLIDKFIGDG